MSKTVTWVHVGDLHMDEADGLLSKTRLQATVAEINTWVGAAADFVFLPGDNANHATPAQYAHILEALEPLGLPWRAIAGDHDFEPGDLAHYEAAFPAANRPEVEVIAGHRCIFLDMISAGAGGPDFRLTMHHRNRLFEELARAEAERQTPIVFMHGYPGDLAADGDVIARTLADARVAFVDTGHTHYNELLNDGRVVYGATRSTGQIEEDDGQPGYAIVTVHDRVPSWRFKTLGSPWPFVQIVAPSDYRMVTRPADPQQVPRPGTVEIVAKVYGHTDQPASLRFADTEWAMTGPDEAGLVRVAVTLPAGLHRLTVACGTDQDSVSVLVRDVDDIPRRGVPVAPGRDIHSVGPWPEHGIAGTQLGPNKNGRRW
ncbi:metallophosphoesterase [Sphingomonas sp. TREG-RG-20F-R18-01]|uniref:metallophosphoesterase family protein n=1 Tax=Sphingomonas sp. TREG-RG-20F-R18-01 TaxID=2914982 RepID=UPI001F567FFE|nr:metallophosphoesterase [Sphingomonas sp. TREG-RG-20F-R18-01]